MYLVRVDKAENPEQRGAATGVSCEDKTRARHGGGPQRRCKLPEAEVHQLPDTVDGSERRETIAATALPSVEMAAREQRDRGPRPPGKRTASSGIGPVESASPLQIPHDVQSRSRR